jgi:hypothetical protein
MAASERGGVPVRAENPSPSRSSTFPESDLDVTVPTRARTQVRVLQMNLCDSGLAGCYTGRSGDRRRGGDPRPGT